MKTLLVCAALFAAAASAAEIDGTWKGTAEFQGNTIERTFVFKTDGAKVTGETTSQMMGKSAISDGKLEGDTLSFTIVVKFQENEMKLRYTGKIANKEIRFRVESDAGTTLEYLAKKVS